MRFLFTSHQSVDTWCKFAISASKVIILRYSRNSRLQEIYLFRNKVQYVNSKAVKPGFCVKMEVTRVPPGRPSRTISGTQGRIKGGQLPRALRSKGATVMTFVCFK